MIGKTLGHYQITEKLGEGGMREIYPSEDRRTCHQVAFKILPDEDAHDAKGLDCFKRRAMLLSHEESQGM